MMNTVFSGIFFVEMIIKLIGLGVREYVRDRFNIFDCLIVIVATVDIILAYSVSFSNDISGAITALRALRLFRVFKLVKAWKKF
jgi:hypothetical protein